MTCDALLDGTLGRLDREARLRHLEACPDCRELLGALALAGEAPDEPELRTAILARTSGGACASAQARLCDRVDGQLDAVDAELVDAHVRHCAECADLLRALASIPAELARLAALDPGPAFVDEVLERTSRRRRRVPRGFDVSDLLARLFARPRVAWEGAFVATLLLAAPTLVPRSPFADLPHRAFAQLRGTVSEVEATVVVRARDAWGSTADLAHESTDAWDAIRRRLGTFVGSAASDQARGENGGTQADPTAAQETSP